MLVVSLLIAIPIGILSAVKQYSGLRHRRDHLLLCRAGHPGILAGVDPDPDLLRLAEKPVHRRATAAGGRHVFHRRAGFRSPTGSTHLILPVTTGALGWIAWYSRFLRSSMLDVIHQDYMRTARAKGLAQPQVIYKHALRNALIPLVTLLALDLPYLIQRRGLCRDDLFLAGHGQPLLPVCRSQRDYPVLMAILIIGAALHHPLQPARRPPLRLPRPADPVRLARAHHDADTRHRASQPHSLRLLS